MPKYQSKSLPSPVFPDDQARNAEMERWAAAEAREEPEHLVQPRVTSARYESDLLRYQRSLRSAEESRRQGFDFRIDGRMSPEQARRNIEEARRKGEEARQENLRRRTEKERAIYERLTPAGPVTDALGKLWASPLTAVGAAAGSLNVLASRLAGNKDARVTMGNNAIQFENGLIGPTGAKSAFTLGNSVLYGPATHPDTPIKERYDKKQPMHATFGDHEKAHTYRYGSPFFLPGYAGSMIFDGIRGKPNRYEVEADDFAEESARRMRK